MPPQPIQIRAEPEDFKGRYANHIIVTSQERDVVIDFNAAVKIGDQANVSLVSRLFLNRFTAQELAELLQKTIAEWERRRYDAPEAPPTLPTKQ